ncbi:type I-F CRISPR-associated protein Cas7f/Csy3 [Endozoicomonas euniceicola]|uniref:Type I-F CRISPR-associated protein Cas7f/Csy3 n=1 Tax=Endozoicomonas euniceicola TaxID=1234143 RepID=A0ABY6GW65_9GAMM|nr:type I-F CRISPR-associated protein Cas7f/Csy3 [Endozoicomonas euniceicola]UYM16288.1 type I-F CRISPR-associated protein Cas7f/Csy3 [Endozoicomonas euniceicola]
MKLQGGASFERSIEAAFATFWAVDEQGRYLPLEKDRWKNTAPFADVNSIKGKNLKNLNSNNIVDKEMAILPAHCSTLAIKTQFDFLDCWRELASCTTYAVREKIEEFGSEFERLFGFEVFAKAYLENILNLRWCWRNYNACRIGRAVKVKFNEKVHEFKLGTAKEFYALSDIAKSKQDRSVIDELVELIVASLSGDHSFPRIEVEALFYFGGGMEVYPSQLFPVNDKERRKILATTDGENGIKQVCFTKEKILNAIHTIDRWYVNGDNGEGLEPVNINPVAYDKKYAICWRDQGEKNDLYSIISSFEKMLLAMKKRKEPNQDEMFLMAFILKGGLMAEKNE